MGNQLINRVFKKALGFVMAAGVIFSVNGQFGNEWIDPGQTYYKIKTGQDQIYRLSYDQIVAAGIPVGSILPGRYRIFHRGVEQAIYVASQTDTPLQPGDFIEFYGQSNDGTLDLDLYRQPDAQPHNFYNLYSDTTAYFLTWNPSANGRRMALSNLFNLDNLPAEANHISVSRQVYITDFSQGRVYPEGAANAETRLSVFDYGEGWTGARILKGQSRDFVVTNLNGLETSNVSPVIKLVLAGRNNQPHNFEVLVGSDASNLRSLGTYEFQYYNNLVVQEDLAFGDISPTGTLTVRLNVIGQPDIPADAISLSLLEVNLPQVWDMNSQNLQFFQVQPNPQGTSFVRISNPPSDARIFDITQRDNPIRIDYTADGGNIEAVIPNTQISRTLVVVGTSVQPANLDPITVQSWDPAQFDYLIITHNSLRQPTGTSSDPVQDYANYRASSEGGGFKPLVVEIQTLYDHFNYGEISPRAIYKFLEFMWNGGDPQFAFIIGKSLTVDHDFHRKGSPSGTTLEDLVPTAGFPGSDILFTAGLGNTTFESAIPTGRLIAQTPTQVEGYASKVREMEALPYDELWRKDLLHLSGGLTISEVNRFLGYVQGYEEIAEDDYLGGQAITKSKEGNSNRELINVSDIVNSGVGLITFYGHSAPNLTDIEIGDVSNPELGYANKGKYPSILVNGCNSGNIFSTASSFGEDWILTPELGAISYMAHSATGFESALNLYTRMYYTVAFADSTLNYQRIGHVQTETSTRFLDQYFNSETNISQVQQVVLQGDPASFLFGADRPDYRIDNAGLFLQGFNGSPVTATADSFQLAMVVENPGRTQREPLEVIVSRTANQGHVNVTDTMEFDPTKYIDTLYFTIPNQGTEGAGENRFEVSLDPRNLLPELDELNNSAQLLAVIPLGGTENLFPANFGLVSSTGVNLVAQSSDRSSGPRSFVFELDTSRTFQSPLKQSNVVESQTIASWETSITDQDSLVFYWRTRYLNRLPDEDTTWAESSFTYLKGSSEGWSQSHYQQIEQNGSVGMEIDPDTRVLTYDPTSSLLDITTHGATNASSDPVNSRLVVNGQNLIVATPDNRVCRDDAIAAVAFRRSTTVPYAVLANSGFDVLDPERCGITPQVINSLRNTDIEGSADRLSAFLDMVPAGDYVLLFSIGNVTFQNWNNSLLNKLEGIGASASSISSMGNGEPWILLGRKGLTPGQAQEIKADPGTGVSLTDQEISLTAEILGRETQGSVTPTLIGPARSWTNFQQILQSLESPSSDLNQTRISGVTLSGEVDVLVDDLEEAVYDLSNLDAEQYPFLSLTLNTEDNQNLTPAQFGLWQVLYQGAPEGILLQVEGQETTSVKEGAVVVVQFTFNNISQVSFEDSLLVQYSVFNQESRTTESGQLRITPPAPGQGTEFAITINTLGKPGKNDLSINVNPREQVEQVYTNNIFNLVDYLQVNPDQSNPVLDVTFDGRYILDGEIVSPNPFILIKVIDENDVLVKDDTVGIGIMIKPPCENCGFESVNFTDPEVTWTPATEDSDFTVEYRPTALKDGVYTMRVQGSDKTGNQAGSDPYSVRFEVINESTVTNFYPYPNPFSTSTRFVFTLTGAEIPDEIKIQIMTVSGIIVREITQDEIGPIRIGNNITEYAWDGRDEFGDQLANGVYLYRVFIRSQGQSLEQRETSADQAFKRGFGKLYLLR